MIIWTGEQCYLCLYHRNSASLIGQKD